MMHTHTSRTTQRTPGIEGQMGSWAPYYDFIMALLTLGRERTLRQMTVELAGVKPGDRVLEIGCGTGSLSLAAQAVAGPSGAVHGIDAAPEMVEAARRKAARQGADVDFKVGLLQDIPFSKAQFDVVLCSFMIFHLPDDARREGFKEIARVLKPGGQVVIVDSVSPDGLSGLLLRSLPQHTLEELRPMLREAGFLEIETGLTRFKAVGFARAKTRSI